MVYVVTAVLLGVDGWMATELMGGLGARGKGRRHLLPWHPVSRRE